MSESVKKGSVEREVKKDVERRGSRKNASFEEKCRSIIRGEDHSSLEKIL